MVNSIMKRLYYCNFLRAKLRNTINKHIREALKTFYAVYTPVNERLKIDTIYNK